MRILNLTVLFVSLLFINHSIAQNAILDFTVLPQTYAGAGTYNPNYWANGGCPTYHQFGPNPLPVNGYNVRTSGSMNILPTYTNTSAKYHLSIYAFGNTNIGQRENNAISVEYPFQANKSYLVEIEGVNDHSWDGNGTAGKRHNGVFWVKLDNDPNLPTTSESPCVADYTPVEKSVGRYSKLIADPVFSILGRNHQVKFSLKEAKSALKITFDASPYVQGIKIDNIFRLAKIKITEIPYEEDGRYSASYSNVPRPPRGTPGYEIDIETKVPNNDNRNIRGLTDFSVTNNNWILDSNGVGYSVYPKDIVTNLAYKQLNNVYILGGNYSNPRTGVVEREIISLPASYNGSNYNYDVVNGELVITCSNANNSVPLDITDFRITYYQQL